MRIVIPYDNGEIAPQLEEAGVFKLYNLENGQILSEVTVPAFGSGEVELAGFLQTVRADVLICGGIRAEARKRAAAAGIAVWPGLGGRADDAARAFAAGSFRAAAGCGHDHSHESCDEHNCPYHQNGGCPGHRG